MLYLVLIKCAQAEQIVKHGSCVCVSVFVSVCESCECVSMLVQNG